MTLSSERRAARRRNLVDAAQTLIRERGDAGFSMMQVAERAGVSPATPYNLLGSKSHLLGLVIEDDHEKFAKRLDGMPRAAALARLLAALDMVVSHYEADRQFHRGLFRAAFNAESADIRAIMTAQARTFWMGLVEAACEAGEFMDFVRPGPLTNILLRTISGVARGWIAEQWAAERFAQEMSLTVRLVLASVVSPSGRAALELELSAGFKALSQRSLP